MDGRLVSLRRSAALAAYSTPDLRRLARLSEWLDAAPGQTLVRRGTRRPGCFLLLDGSVVTTVDDECWLTTRPGSLLGLGETVADVVADAEVVALTSSSLLVFTAPALAGALDAIAPLRHAALTQLARRHVAGA